jgi:2-oxo-4-hydroxy-4-carboxy--5-ureidoimidazoline (OHCU) decarboxylase
MLRLRDDDPLAMSLLAAIRSGDLPSLKRLLREHPALASATIGEEDAQNVSSQRAHLGLPTVAPPWVRYTFGSVR